MKETRRINSRYLAYCAENGSTPDEQMASDRAIYPGAGGTGFVLWIAARWREWRAEAGFPQHAAAGPKQHAEFDAWLASRQLMLDNCEAQR